MDNSLLLARMLKHAFIAGYQEGAKTHENEYSPLDVWVEYEPHPTDHNRMKEILKKGTNNGRK